MKSFLLIFLLCGTTSAWAVAKGDACNSANPCDAELYCDGTTNKCASCSEATGGSHPHSVAGSKSINSCYETCGTIPVTLGRKNPKRSTVYYNNYCEYTLSCVTNAEQNESGSACKCKDNYQQEGSGTEATCGGKCYTLTLVKNLTNVAESNKYLYVKYGTGFYKTSGCSGTALANTDEWITPTFKWWQTFNGYSRSPDDKVNLLFGSDGKPKNGTNSTTFTGNTTLYGQWNAGSYRVEYYINSETTADGGNQTCQVVTADTNSPTTNDCKAKTFPDWCKIADGKGKIIIGWTKTKGGTTVQIRKGDNVPPSAGTESTIKLYAVWDNSLAGYYCGSTGSNGLQKCTKGTTSDAGSIAQTACYITNATQFRDNLSGDDVFTLPITKIEYTGR